jgi:hypothetical protein
MSRTEAKYMVISEVARKAIYKYLIDFRNKLVGVTMTTKELKNQQVTYYFITG